MSAPRGVDLLAVGELIIDLVSTDVVESIGDATTFRRHIGGGPVNLALTATRLGARAAVVGCVGGDGLGAHARAALAASGVDVTAVRTVAGAPTTTSIIARSSRTPDFVIHRGADRHLTPEDVPADLAGARAVHVDAFVLSQQPSRSAALATLARADGRALVSLDPSYHRSVWDDADPLAVFAAACRHVDVAKPSLDDCQRLFGAGCDPAAGAQRFLDWGVGLVLLTLGADGVLVRDAEGLDRLVTAPPTEVVDVNGAGDAFLAGALVALLDGADPLAAARVGTEVARRKVGIAGHLPGPVDRAEVYAAAAFTPDPASDQGGPRER